MDLSEKQVSYEYIYRGRIIRLRSDDALLPNGNTAKREVVEHNGGVGILPITEDGSIVLVEQFRYPYFEILTEIPAGKLEPGEDPLDCGRRELKEETGYTAENFIPLGQLYPTPGYCNEIIYLYAATGLHSGNSNPDPDEFLHCKTIALSDAIDYVVSGQIKDAKTQTAILKTNLMIEKGIIKF